MAVSTSKKYTPLYLDESIHREIMVYAAETGQTIQEIIKPETDECIQAIIKRVSQIKEMRKQAYLKTLREEEEKQLAAENPLIVPGHEVEPISV